jgi:hypothetical protein
MPAEPFDIYADGAQVSVSPFTVTLSFTLAPPGPTTAGAVPIRIGEIRMSQEHAKVMAIILRRQLKAYEDSSGQQIPVHPQVWQQLGLSRQEDW